MTHCCIRKNEHQWREYRRHHRGKCPPGMLINLGNVGGCMQTTYIKAGSRENSSNRSSKYWVSEHIERKVSREKALHVELSHEGHIIQQYLYLSKLHLAINCSDTVSKPSAYVGYKLNCPVLLEWCWANTHTLRQRRATTTLTFMTVCCEETNEMSSTAQEKAAATAKIFLVSALPYRGSDMGKSVTALDRFNALLPKPKHIHFRPVFGLKEIKRVSSAFAKRRRKVIVKFRHGNCHSQ